MPDANDNRGDQFIGRFTNKIDAKGRTFLPAKLKPLVFSRWSHRPDLMLTVMGFDRCLVLVDRKSWFDRRARFSGIDWLDADTARFRRLSSLAEEVSPDKNGRITIPPFLREFARLEDEVLFVGCEEYLELWNPQLAKKDLDELLDDTGSLIDRIREKQTATVRGEPGTNGTTE
jgi:MraZ protein